MNGGESIRNTTQSACRLLLFALVTTAVASDANGQPTAVEVSPITYSKELQSFLEKLDPITERGFIRTLRPGDTGIGYTLETLLEIEENNSPRGDFMGMEIKAYRDTETEFDDTDKMNLFLKEPEWIDRLTATARLKDYGYQDDNGRQAWYLSVTSRENDAGLKLKVSEERDAVSLIRHGHTIGTWTAEVLSERLLEKHSQSVFIAAATRGEGTDEEFWYRTVTWCRDPSVGRLLELIENGDVIVELRMHLRPDESVRNHGTAFRVRKHKLRHLFAVQQRVRPIKKPPGNQRSPDGLDCVSKPTISESTPVAQ